MTHTQTEENKLYALNEVAKLELIPGVTGYQTVYQMVTVLDSENKRQAASETTEFAIKPWFKVRPGSKIAGKLHIEEKELIKFLMFYQNEPQVRDRLIELGLIDPVL